ncbi:MAG TPA: hypothetical protein PK530_23310, partial [Anaerolineales bacterium]|nr:hypothetical protein [Anaerolineales bacterium]
PLPSDTRTPSPTFTPEPSKTSEPTPTSTFDWTTIAFPTPKATFITNDEVLETVYFFDPAFGTYGSINPSSEQQMLEVVLISVSASDETQTGPGKATYLEFANFSDKMAYWISGVQSSLWLSDLEGQQRQMIFLDAEQKYTAFEISSYPYNEVDLIWTPDDLHLLVDFLDEDLQDFIYHLQSNTLENWNYECNQLALSPKSAKVALWCQAQSGDGFAVIEWGGEIWTSEEPPKNILAERTQKKPPIWGWSSDGGKIAFWDPFDPRGLLHIVDSKGIDLGIYSVSAYWLSDEKIQTVKHPIQWSRDGSRLLVYGLGSESSPCPPWWDFWGSQNYFLTVPCFQVVDVSTGEIVWTMFDSMGQIVNEQNSFLLSIHFARAAISANGKYLIISGASGGQRLSFIVDVMSASIFPPEWPMEAEDLVWSKE